jgi:hypothetical protein
LTDSVNDYSRYPRLPEGLLWNARLLPDRVAALSLWPKGAVIAEIGTALGGYSEQILRTCQPARFIAIDRYDLHEIPVLWGKTAAETFGARTHVELYRDRFKSEIAAGVVEVIQGDSAASITALPDDSVDVFYVDADHLYAGVRADLAALLPKVRRDGWIVMNDYIPADTFSNVPLGVIQATNEFMVEHGWEMTYLALAPMMYCDVGLRRLGMAEPGPGGAVDPSLFESPRLVAAESRARAAEAALAATRRSASWRVTAPLRALSRLIRRRG